MTGIGTIANVFAIALGGALGTVAVRAIPARVNELVMQCLGLAVMLIGLQMAWTANELLVVIPSLALGAALGELLRIEERLETSAKGLERWFSTANSDVTRTFVGVTLLYCVGPMAITGSFADGLQGNPSILYAKAILDGVGAIMFASALRFAVVLTAVPVFIYQMLLTFGAGQLSRILTDPIINEMSATGGLLVLALGCNLAGLAKFRVGNMLPALVIVAIITALKLAFFPA